MTLVAFLWPRNFKSLPPATDRFFEVAPGSKILARCHWQPDPRRSPALVLIHGLEGSSESGQMLGIAERAWAAGFSVLRLNLRNCGGTESLTPTLYNSGQSEDLRAVLSELIGKDEIPALFFAGYSMGGNIVLKMAGELSERAPAQLRGVCAVCPTLELALCVDRSALSRNRLYQWHFVRSLKQRALRKAKLFPDLYNLDGLDRVRTLREFDDLITAPHFGYRDAADYYFRASALRVAANIGVPALILAAKNDPLVPPGTFLDSAVAGNSRIRVSLQTHGGHCAFISANPKERYWAEARIVEFCGEILDQPPLTPRASRVTR